MKENTILIIDDHDSIRFILGNILSKSYHIIAKKDGIDALAWFQQGNIPDLILLDMQMPRLGGLDFLRNIRSSGFFSKIPVLIITGNENPKYITQCEQLNINGYLTKPFNLEELHYKIHTILPLNSMSLND